MEQKEIVCSVVIHTDQKTEELKKALRALENQTAGFPEGTQVLLIENKGDEEQHRLCSDFREKYGENVRILSASTVSSLKELRQYIRGCYVNISGEGDYWDADALRIVRKAISALPQSGGRMMEAPKYRKTAVREMFQKPARKLLPVAGNITENEAVLSGQAIGISGSLIFAKPIKGRKKSCTIWIHLSFPHHC